MISIIKFWNAVNNRAVTGTVGYDSTFIEKVNQAQVQAQNTILPFYEDNQAVKDALSLHVTPIVKSTSITGELTKEADYMYFIAVISAAGTTAFPINNNEVSIINSSPIRKPNIDKGRVFYYWKKNSLFFLPAQVMSVDYTYIRAPKDAKIVLNPVDIPNRDYLVPSTNPADIQDLEWPDKMFDLLMYLTLEKLGMEMKEPILVEYANMGLSREMVTTLNTESK